MSVKIEKSAESDVCYHVRDVNRYKMKIDIRSRSLYNKGFHYHYSSINGRKSSFPCFAM